jgi:type VI protein secretion system component Hcp
MDIGINMSETIYIGIDDKRIEATGKQLDYILQTQAEAQAEQARIEAEAQAKQAKLESAKAKLAALGLDEEEVAAIVGGI